MGVVAMMFVRVRSRAVFVVSVRVGKGLAFVRIRAALDLDVHSRHLQARAHRFFGAQMELADGERGEAALDLAGVDAEIDERPERHVAADPVEAIEVKMPCHRPLAASPNILLSPREGAECKESRLDTRLGLFEARKNDETTKAPRTPRNPEGR
jgi:hypothetical protein